MPKTGMKQEVEITTRNVYTKVQAEFEFRVDGRELPSMAVMGEAFEAAIALVQEKITESYKVPARVATPESGAPPDTKPAQEPNKLPEGATVMEDAKAVSVVAPKLPTNVPFG
jgi:hypothetical protein